MKSSAHPSCPARNQTAPASAATSASPVSAVQAPTLKHKIAFALVMGVITTGTISFALIALNLGFGERFLRTWLKSWAMGYAVVIPAILILGPLVQRMVDRVLAKPTPV
jgi:hypothetical protein